MPFDIDFSNTYVWHSVATVVLAVVMLVVTRLSKNLASRFIEDPARQYRMRKTIGRMAAVVFAVLLIALWGPDPGDVVTVLTIIGAGIAISMRETLLSIAGWFNIVVRGPYKPGDRIEMNGILGDVIDIRLLHTTLMEVGGWVDADQSTGRIVHLPNAWVFLHGIYNSSHGFNFVWHELPVTVTFGSDWSKAREVMMEMASESAAIVEAQAASEIRRMSREYLVHYSILTPFVYVTITDRGVRLTLRYLSGVRKRRGTEHAFTVNLLTRFREHGITLAPNTLVGFHGGAFQADADAPTAPKQKPG